METTGMTETPKKRTTNHRSTEKESSFRQPEKSIGRIKKNKKKDASFFKKSTINSSDLPHEAYSDEETQNYQTGLQEGEPPREAKTNTSQSGRIVRNNSKQSMNYYKSEDIVYEGRTRKG